MPLFSTSVVLAETVDVLVVADAVMTWTAFENLRQETVSYINNPLCAISQFYGRMDQNYELYQYF